jgi:hypothetical protein
MKMGVAAAAVAGTALATAPVAMAASNGLSFITDPSSGKNLNSGNENSAWQVSPVNGATCSGASSTNGYFVTGYLSTVDITTNPGAFTWDATGPHTATGVTQPLIDASHSTYVNRNTDNPLPSGEGPVQNTGPMTWSDFTDADIPTGDYHIGLACVHGTTLDRFYDTQIHFTSNGTSLTWSTIPNPQVPEFPVTVLLPISAGLVAAAGGFVLYRRRQKATTVAASA